jgi:hypothetical protein
LCAREIPSEVELSALKFGQTITMLEDDLRAINSRLEALDAEASRLRDSIRASEEELSSNRIKAIDQVEKVVRGLGYPTLEVCVNAYNNANRFAKVAMAIGIIPLIIPILFTLIPWVVSLGPAAIMGLLSTEAFRRQSLRAKLQTDRENLANVESELTFQRVRERETRHFASLIRAMMPRGPLPAS